MVNFYLLQMKVWKTIVLTKKRSSDWLKAELGVFFFFHGKPFYMKEELRGKLIIQTQVFGRHLLENKVSLLP